MAGKPTGTRMNGIDFTQLGVSGVVAVLLIVAVKVLWGKYQEEITGRRADQDEVVPALLAMTSAMTEFIKVSNRMADRERGL